MSKLEQFVEVFSNSVGSKHPSLRTGQFLINLLADFDMDAYKAITGQPEDCFYNDRKMVDTFKFLEKYWNK